MFDLGIQEIVVVFIIALLVYGPKDLPVFGRKVGKYIAMFKRMVSDVKRQVDTELYDYSDPIKAEIEKINREAMQAALKPPLTQPPEQPAAESAATEIPPVTPRHDGSVPDGTVPNGK
ncbi:sec-independent protein translocase protein TatA [Candidatus Magnetominusculus xianensis]|uniref:Sec-independent protein translocase protein TatA n=1 Tax=Candidatus Magnetominusculus xianensis TaxID=1748249 RepID=A0ABR5SN24_9BACT|nr:sec-independent protein translocase protein TatA [Candidatus Magnetominusculus xianensis]